MTKDDCIASFKYSVQNKTGTKTGDGSLFHATASKEVKRMKEK